MKNTFIHFTEFNLDTIESIFKNGIMSSYNLQKNGIYKDAGIGNNGKYYISLTKNTNYQNSAFNLFKHNPNNIGIEVISNYAIKTKKINCFLFTNTKLPIRYSIYDDEWQTKEIITPDKFISFYYPLEFIYDLYKKDTNYLNYISEEINKIKELMKIYNINIPLNTNEKVYKL
jgi:hypothetical protein